MTLPRSADVVVVGGGVMGASVAYHLAARGASVALLERGAVCSGTTRHSTTLIRLHYTQPLLVRMAAHGLRAYLAFDDAVGCSSGFTRTGMLFAAAERELLERNVEVGRSEGAETHVLDEDAVRELDGRIDPGGLAWCYEPQAGYCDAYAVTRGYADAAARLGAHVAEGVAVTRVSDDGVVTTAGDVAAGAVVVAAGIWSPPLLAPLGYDLPLRAARAEVGRWRLPEGFGTTPPAVAEFASALLYFRPAEPGYLEVGTLDASHADTPVDPDRCPEGADRATLDGYAAALVRRVPQAAGGHWRGAWSGVYDVTPDWEPAIGLVPGSERVHVAAGFSGHGFKLAPAVGTTVAETVLDGAPQSFDTALLDPGRFARGELVAARYGYSVLG